MKPAAKVLALAVSFALTVGLCMYEPVATTTSRPIGTAATGNVGLYMAVVTYSANPWVYAAAAFTGAVFLTLAVIFTRQRHASRRLRKIRKEENR